MRSSRQRWHAVTDSRATPLPSHGAGKDSEAETLLKLLFYIWRLTWVSCPLLAWQTQRYWNRARYVLLHTYSAEVCNAAWIGLRVPLLSQFVELMNLFFFFNPPTQMSLPKALLSWKPPPHTHTPGAHPCLPVKKPAVCKSVNTSLTGELAYKNNEAWKEARAEWNLRAREWLLQILDTR